MTPPDSLKDNPVAILKLPKDAELIMARGRYHFYRMPKDPQLPYQIWSMGIYVAGFNRYELGHSYLMARCG